MHFKEYINNEKTYKELCKYGHGIIHKSFKGESNYLLNQEEKEDILSSVFEELSIKNGEIINSESFKKGHFANYVWNKGASYLNSKHKKRLHFPKVNSANLIWDEYKESKEVLNKIKDEKLKNIMIDKFYNELTNTELKEKHNIKSVDKIYKKVKKDIMNTKKGNYVGVARMLNGKIDKVYESVTSVKKDKFDVSRVCAICRGSYKGQHKGFDWVYVKNLKLS